MADGAKRRSTHPQGTSGGPVFYIGDFDNLETYRAGANFQPMFEAIIIRKPTEGPVLVAVRVGAIIGALKHKGLLPESR
jgi:hypothetical protein